jgi:hypothetical protein
VVGYEYSVMVHLNRFSVTTPLAPTSDLSAASWMDAETARLLAFTAVPVDQAAV